MTILFDNLRDSYEDEIRSAMKGLPGEHQFFIKIKAWKIEEWASRLKRGTGELRMLDVGCGTGLLEQSLHVPNAKCIGLDVSELLLEKARENVPGCRFAHFDGQNIDGGDNSYHLVFAINVFHHIAIKNRMQLLMEMWRVLRPNGLLAIFEHNPWHPITRRVVSRCSFDSDAVLLSRSNACSLLRTVGLHSIDSSYMVFLPWSIGINLLLERVFGWLPLGTQYYATGVK